MLTCHCTLFCENNFRGAGTPIFGTWNVTNVLPLHFVKFASTSPIPPQFLVSIGVMFSITEALSSDRKSHVQGVSQGFCYVSITTAGRCWLKPPHPQTRLWSYIEDTFALRKPWYLLKNNHLSEFVTGKGLTLQNCEVDKLFHCPTSLHYTKIFKVVR